ncbi:phytanoyl-CoA dioxygenase family protein [Nocardia sp. CDC159]|uniref:Phytanoyl-CoA dioxygenase family protein n=1 Tax=Nocardia pulmonis TaxID=2951408 RepID=A0A9X2E711_9NOCA|nr:MULTISPECIES: phytanoyl-CoA dioxygenase family protein [Nocardia]MCM6772816.1 phytanoyl-CoA dioxygenase family protein [Nocardia pulmonis]MCM6785881.1 phytanoyl-CoA dioxygenase family protein [Nocardia sp. CDC159]
MLTEAQLEGFVAEGFVKVEHAFAPETAAAGREILWRATGCTPDDPATWTQPVIRLGDHAEQPFRIAVTAPALTEAFDQLVGFGRWLPRNSLGGWPIRFPSEQPPGDDGWHVDASFAGDDPADFFTWRINVRTQGRALLMLFLFSDVDAEDAPTRIRVGSHLRLPAVLAPHGDRGLAMSDPRVLECCNAGTEDLPQVSATGRAGDVYLCHPFLVHAAQPNRTGRPKFMAQPPLLLREPCDLDRADGAYSPVEQAIRRGLALSGQGA